MAEAICTSCGKSTLYLEEMVGVLSCPHCGEHLGDFESDQDEAGQSGHTGESFGRSRSPQEIAEQEYLARCPRSIRLAASIWICFGFFAGLLAGVLALQVVFGTSFGAGFRAIGVAQSLLGALFGTTFIQVGLKTRTGKAPDTLGNGIGSVVFGLLCAGAGGMVIAFVGRETGGLIPGILGGANILAGLGLLAAGVLALKSRNEYKGWRRA